jgi:transposase
MEPMSLFTTALGLEAPWQVVDVQFDPEKGRIDFEVAFGKGKRFTCPACAAEAQPVHDSRVRSWRHLNFFQYEAYIRGPVPRVRCRACGKTTQISVPWARAHSGFTLLMEALVVTLCRAMPVNTVATLLKVSDDRLWGILHHYVDEARAKEDHHGVTRLGVDETASRRGQNYISLFHDLDGRRLLFACEGRSQKAVKAFTEDLACHGGDPSAIEHVCIDMSAAYIAGVAKHLPQADVTFDAFHVIKLASEALEEVRREEVKTEPSLRGTRWTWLKSPQKWTLRQTTDFHWLSRTRLKTATAWRLKESLRDLYASATDSAHGAELFRAWYSWARRSRLKPFKRLAITLDKHRKGILAAFDSRISNGRAEGINSLIQAAKARARGYRSTRSLIAISYLVAGNLTHLPTSPFDTISCGNPLAAS